MILIVCIYYVKYNLCDCPSFPRSTYLSFANYALFIWWYLCQYIKQFSKLFDIKGEHFLHDNQHIDYKVLDDQYKGCLSFGFFLFIFYFNEFLIFFGFYLITNIPKGHIEEIFALGSIFSKANNKYSITCVLSDKTCFNLNISQSWKVKSLVYTCK